MKKDVHTEHCCTFHGCKYNDPYCTVVNDLRPQSGPCEECGLELEGFYGEADRREAAARWPNDWRVALAGQ